MNLDEALETRSWDVGGGIVEVAGAVEVVGEAGVDKPVRLIIMLLCRQTNLKAV